MKTKLIINEKHKLMCNLCGRDKFIRKSPHNCIGGYRKRRIVWVMKVENGLWRAIKKK